MCSLEQTSRWKICMDSHICSSSTALLLIEEQKWSFRSSLAAQLRLSWLAYSSFSCMGSATNFPMAECSSPSLWQSRPHFSFGCKEYRTQTMGTQYTIESLESTVSTWFSKSQCKTSLRCALTLHWTQSCSCFATWQLVQWAVTTSSIFLMAKRCLGRHTLSWMMFFWPLSTLQEADHSSQVFWISRVWTNCFQPFPYWCYLRTPVLPVSTARSDRLTS